MDAPKILVSVLNWNNYPDTLQCIESVLLSDYPNFEILLTDNNSIDGSYELLRKKFEDQIHVYRSTRNAGYAGGHFPAMQYAEKFKFDAIWIVNNDLWVHQQALSNLVIAFKEKGLGLFGNFILEQDQEKIKFSEGFGLDLKNQIIFDKYNVLNGLQYSQTILSPTIIPTANVHGAGFLLPCKVFRQFGFMDTNFFLYAEELDYCFKLLLKYKIPSYIVQSSLIFHRGAGSYLKSPKLKLIEIYYRNRNSNILFKKYKKGYKIICPGGFFRMFRLILSYNLKRIFRKEKITVPYREKYYEYLAIFHSILRLKMKYFEPNRFIKK